MTRVGWCGDGKVGVVCATFNFLFVKSPPPTLGGGECNTHLMKVLHYGMIRRHMHIGHQL